jgi:hypothetical protein
MAMAKKQAGTAPAGVLASFGATPSDYVQIYSPTQGATVGSPVVLQALVKALGGALGTTVQVTQATPATLGTPLGVPGVSFTYPLASVSVPLVAGLNVLEVQLLVNGTVVASDQVVVSLPAPTPMPPPPPMPIPGLAPGRVQG